MKPGDYVQLADLSIEGLNGEAPAGRVEWVQDGVASVRFATLRITAQAERFRPYQPNRKS